MLLMIHMPPRRRSWMAAFSLGLLLGGASAALFLVT